MRIDRLLAITTYLLNRNIVTGHELAEQFEVSERTIQRDMDTINQAGIPIVSHKGIGGGYQILDSFELKHHAVNQTDIQYILMALKGFQTAFDSPQTHATMEKLQPLSKSSNPFHHIQVDLSVAHENPKINQCFQLLNQAIEQHQIVEIHYTNSTQQMSQRRIHPITLNYQWYAWYVTAFCEHANDYRIFKLSRIQHITFTDESFSSLESAPENLFQQQMRHDHREYVNIQLRLNRDIQGVLQEYFPNGQWIESVNDFPIYQISMPVTERVWYGILLSLGDSVEVIQPDHLRKRIQHDVQNIGKIYKDDI